MPHQLDDVSSALVQIRRESLDIYNRLHSIEEDIAFVNLVHDIYVDLPLIPNLRCGAWYTDPTITRSTPAYFKSTDGHYENWSFNLRRPNLHLLPLIIEHHGLVIVDSTRAGKRIPDAFSKTVPIWCAVINRAIAKVSPSTIADDWDIALYTPPQVVSAQEYAQIEARLDGWANALVGSSYKLPCLLQPLRPLWITPATSAFPKPAKSFLPIICLSASKQVQDGIERRNGGYVYIQGSGDDHELWGMRLTPKCFWNYRDKLLQSSRLDLNGIVDAIVSASTSIPIKGDWVTLPSEILKTAGKLLICSNADLPSPLPSSFLGATIRAVPAAFLQICAPGELALPHTQQLPDFGYSNYVRLEAPDGKRGQSQFLRSVLPESMSFISKQLRMGSSVCISCGTGKDKSVGVALAALQKFFDDIGSFVQEDTTRAPRESWIPACGTSTLNKAVNVASKLSIRTRLQWIISSHPQANPSRTTLKRVNEFLLTSAFLDHSTPISFPPAPASL